MGFSGQITAANASRCEVAQRLAARLDLGAGVIEALDCTFDRWDGMGRLHLKGEAIPIARERAVSGLDPSLVEAACRSADSVLAALDVQSCWDGAVAAEPGEPRMLADEAIDEAASIFADFADLKSAFSFDHSRRVSILAEDAARRRGLDEATVAVVRRAGLRARRADGAVSARCRRETSRHAVPRQRRRATAVSVVA